MVNSASLGPRALAGKAMAFHRPIAVDVRAACVEVGERRQMYNDMMQTQVFVIPLVAISRCDINLRTRCLHLPRMPPVCVVNLC
jgi:hypothetical protein